MKKLLLALFFVAAVAGVSVADFFEDLGQGARERTSVDAVYEKITQPKTDYRISWVNGYDYQIVFNKGDFTDESMKTYVGVATVKWTPTDKQEHLCDGCNLSSGLSRETYYVDEIPAFGGTMVVILLWENPFVLTWDNSLIQMEYRVDESGVRLPVTLQFKGLVPDFGIIGE